MKKTFFLTLASFAFAIGLTCCSGGGGDEVSPAARYLKGQTVEAMVGSKMTFQFSDDFWGESTSMLPCTLISGTGSKEEATIAIVEHTYAAGSSAESDNPEFQTMKLRVQYNQGEVGNDSAHKTFWGFPSSANNVNLGGKGVMLNLTFTDKKNGTCELIVQAGATYTTVSEGDGNKKDYAVNEDNLAIPLAGDTAQQTLGGTGVFTFSKN